MKEVVLQDVASDHAENDMRLMYQGKIKSLQRQANRGLWLLALFLTMSIVAYNSLQSLPPFWGSISPYLGPPPPAGLISSALFVYVFSAIVLALGKIMEGENTKGGWQHLGYLLVFYFFYQVAGVLADYFWAVFATGLTVLGLDGYRVWTISSEQIRASEEELERIKRLANFS